MPSEETWERALADAGVAPGYVRGIEFPGLTGTRIATHIPPGSSAGTGGAFDLTPEERRTANEDRGSHRIVHSGDMDEVAMLGILRAQLEHVRQFDAEPGSYQATVAINESLTPLYGGEPGGAVVYLALPMMRDAQAAGARIVRRVHGPQFGKFYDPNFGLLYRTEVEPGSIETLPMRTVVFGAHADAFVRLIGDDEDEAVGFLVMHTRPEAGAWWVALKEDEMFQNLSATSPAWRPSPEAIAAGTGRGQGERLAASRSTSRPRAPTRSLGREPVLVRLVDSGGNQPDVPGPNCCFSTNRAASRTTRP